MFCRRKAQVGITRADQFPSVEATGAIQNVRNQLFQNAPTFDSIGLQASYIVDFWGQFRRATEASRANLVATEFGQEVVRTTLISNVASDYFLLRQFDVQLEYSKETLKADQEMLRINTIKFKGGESAQTDVLQAELLVEQAESQIISLGQSIEQTENAISILLGRNPAPVARGLTDCATASARSTRGHPFDNSGATAGRAPGGVVAGFRKRECWRRAVSARRGDCGGRRGLMAGRSARRADPRKKSGASRSGGAGAAVAAITAGASNQAAAGRPTGVEAPVSVLPWGRVAVKPVVPSSPLVPLAPGAPGSPSYFLAIFSTSFFCRSKAGPATTSSTASRAATRSKAAVATTSCSATRATTGSKAARRTA